jgi:hypothetical protein
MRTTMNRHPIVLLTAALLASACGSDPIGGARASYFAASLSGAVEAEYQGRGEFHTGTPGPSQKQFQITSTGVGTMSDQSFALTRWDGGRLAKGTYPLRLVGLSGYGRGGTQPQGITFQYFRNGPVVEQFVAESGQLEITESSRKRMEGRFTFTGFRYCLREAVRSNPPVPPVGPCTPATPSLPDAPRITVSGSFMATPLETGSVMLR